MFLYYKYKNALKQYPVMSYSGLKAVLMFLYIYFIYICFAAGVATVYWSNGFEETSPAILQYIYRLLNIWIIYVNEYSNFGVHNSREAIDHACKTLPEKNTLTNFARCAEVLFIIIGTRHILSEYFSLLFFFYHVVSRYVKLYCV